MKAKGSKSATVLSPRGRDYPFTAQYPGRASNSPAMSEQRMSEMELLHQHRQWQRQSKLAKQEKGRDDGQRKVHPLVQKQRQIHQEGPGL